MKKCAFIRSNEVDGCPFGLPVIEACKNAGSAVTHMCPLEAVVGMEKKEKVQKANQRVYVYYKEDLRCLYAADVVEKSKVVNCNFGDTAQGMHLPTGIEGSPLYAQTFSGIGLDGLYAFPLGFYSDNNESRNLFQGLFSLVGNNIAYLIKEGMDNNIVKKLEDGIELTPDEFQELVSTIEDYRFEFEKTTTSPSKVKELADTWNSRKRL